MEVSGILVVLLMVFFFRRKLKTDQLHYGWQWFLKFLPFYGIVLSFTASLNNSETVLILNLIGLFLTILWLYFLYNYFRNKISVAYLLTILMVIVLTIISISSEYTAIETLSIYKEYKLIIWPLAITAVFTIGIGASNQLKKENISEAKHEEDLKRKAELELLVEERTLELQTQKADLEKTLAELEATQSQLIQAEKMASLGELTAGIAHEIQNPLNFVNNFSEVTGELIDELKEEVLKSTEVQDTDLRDELLKDITDNLQKIHHHGNRASSIVKGMLEHSRTSTGQKEPTDVNVLADEYLRLAYHGLRAKDKSFNANYQTSFEENLPKIDAIPQDLGRVFLNIINNAFYAVQGTEKPLVEIATKSQNGEVVVEIKDNGAGISEELKDKIFQPFFTTKPSGKGTGLGLSLSYEIINKGHGGQIEVESQENKGSIFRIKLPIKK